MVAGVHAGTVGQPCGAHGARAAALRKEKKLGLSSIARFKRLSESDLEVAAGAHAGTVGQPCGAHGTRAATLRKQKVSGPSDTPSSQKTIITRVTNFWLALLIFG